MWHGSRKLRSSTIQILFLAPSSEREREREQVNIFGRKVYRKILDLVYENEKENWRILINKGIYTMIKNPTIAEIIRLNRLCWFGHVQRMEENWIPKKVLYKNLEATRLRSRPRNRCQNKVREDGRLVDGKGWKERVYNREKYKKLLRTTRNHPHYAHANGMNEWMNEWIIRERGLEWSRYMCCNCLSSTDDFSRTSSQPIDKRW